MGALKQSASKHHLPERLEDLMNVGVAVGRDLRLIGIKKPSDLKGKDPYELYDRLCRKTKQGHDPCMIDTFIAITRFADGGVEKPWWKYTAERKAFITSGDRKGAVERKQRDRSLTVAVRQCRLVEAE